MKGQGTRACALGSATRADDPQEVDHLTRRLTRRDDPSRKLTILVAGLRRRVDHRQRRHPLFEIASDGLAELGLVPDKIEDVIGDLERETEVRPERAERSDVLRLRLGQERGALAARRVERRGLELDALEILSLGRHGRR